MTGAQAIHQGDTVYELNPPELGPWSTGNTGTDGVWQWRASVPGPHLMISAVIHGNELCGAYALRDLVSWIEARAWRPARGALTLVLGHLEALKRFNAGDPATSRGVEGDLNRQWSVDRLDKPETVEARRAAALRPFVDQADFLLDLHSMQQRAAPLALAGMAARHRDWVRALDLPMHTMCDEGHANGVRMRDWGRFATAGDACAVLVECGAHGSVDSLVVAWDAVARCMVHAGLCRRDELPSHWVAPMPAERWTLEVTHAVTAKSAQFQFAQPFEGLECLPQAGTLLATDVDGPVLTPYDDCVLIMPSRKAQAGHTMVRLARRV